MGAMTPSVLWSWSELTEELDRCRISVTEWHKVWFAVLQEFADEQIKSGFVTRGEAHDNADGEPASLSLRWLLYGLVGDEILRKVLLRYITGVHIHCNVHPIGCVYVVERRVLHLYRTNQIMAWTDETARAVLSQIAGIAMFDALYPEQRRIFDEWWPLSNGLLGSSDPRYAVGRLLGLLYRRQHRILDAMAKKNQGFRELICWGKIRWRDQGIEVK
jgi:hypothetical protein